MNTSDLIDIMSQDSEPQTSKLRSLSLCTLGALAMSSILMLGFWGVRPDISQAIAQPLVMAKHLLPFFVALPGLYLLNQARHPEESLDGRLRWTMIPVALLALLIIFSLSALPSSEWLRAITGETLVACLLSVPLLAMPILACLLWVLKQGATSQPALVGALCGIAAGCFSAGIYAFHCYEDNPVFYGIWYTFAILFVGVVGQQLGSRLLRW